MDASSVTRGTKWSWEMKVKEGRMQVSEIFSMGGRGGGCGCDCGDGGGRGHRGFSKFGDFNNRHFDGHRFRRSGFFHDGFRHGRHHDGLLGIRISL
jgi:hypothetical protein